MDLDLNLGLVFLTLSPSNMMVVFLRFMNLENWLIELVIWILEMVFCLIPLQRILESIIDAIW